MPCKRRRTLLDPLYLCYKALHWTQSSEIRTGKKRGGWSTHTHLKLNIIIFGVYLWRETRETVIVSLSAATWLQRDVSNLMSAFVRLSIFHCRHVFPTCTNIWFEHRWQCSDFPCDRPQNSMQTCPASASSFFFFLYIVISILSPLKSKWGISELTEKTQKGTSWTSLWIIDWMHQRNIFTLGVNKHMESDFCFKEHGWIVPHLLSTDYFLMAKHI